MLFTPPCSFETWSLFPLTDHPDPGEPAEALQLHRSNVWQSPEDMIHSTQDTLPLPFRATTSVTSASTNVSASVALSASTLLNILDHGHL